ncbi:hypothetical protein GCM10011415_06400 [Salipiger pallidus]|uniref:Uncharacterized protein n=1 Tax=Salipiger pallidus TaxID=1775170 RepID=A0A8J2ZGV6_9RHOB|nr:hypothetical protein [Salipiger pallidus]GGG62760.1 hypothetical protein GCM10011415_06400 [Salipiger pallidus]
MPAWPTNVPFFTEASGFTRSGPQGAVIRTQMSKGPAKVRRRTSAVVQNVRGVTPPLTRNQVSAFEAFFAQEIGMGALSFTAVVPDTQKEESLRFVGSYEIRALSSNRFEVSGTLEILP